MKPFYINNSLVESVWQQQQNYKEVVGKNPTGDVYLYFAGNSIYYPNTEEVFRRTIVENDHYEFLNFKANSASTHVFIRDVHKQWYVTGISQALPDLPSVVNFLKRRYAGRAVTVVGSSAGGYAAIIAGVLLKARCVFAFSPQLDLNALAEAANWDEYQLVRDFKDASSYAPYSNPANFADASGSVPIFYFANSNSEDDQREIEIAKQSRMITTFIFKGDIHGVPVISTLLPHLLAASPEKLMRVANPLKVWDKHIFGFHICGLKYFALLAMYKAYRAIKNVGICLRKKWLAN
ncbi:MAG TPA: hypothetical protein DCX06_07255 [Opitutae bacterium]|nr:hypothetical protein [Opitutae bacterium]